MKHSCPTCVAALRWLLMLMCSCMAVPSVGQSYTWDNFVQEYTDGLLTSDDDSHEGYDPSSDGTLHEWDA